VTEAWVHRYSNVVSNVSDSASKVVADAAGDIIVTGTAGSDMLTIKYSGTDGSVLWQQRDNGPANFGDVPNGLAVDGNGNVVVTGFSQTAPRGGWFNLYADYYTAKYAAVDGALLWEKRYNGPAHGSDQATALALDRGGNVVVTGLSQSPTIDEFGDVHKNTDYYTAKYAAADGALLWEKRYDRPRSYGEGEFYGYAAPALAVDSSGDVVVMGSFYLETEGNFDQAFYMAKYAGEDGALIWEKLGPIGGGNWVAVDGTGNVVVTGSSGGDYYTFKYAAADGALLWKKRYNGTANEDDFAKAVAVDGDGNVVVTGTSPGLNGNSYTAKYAAVDGALLWEKRSNDFASALAVDGSGNVVLTGFFYNGTNGDYSTAKYAAADGALLWERRYNGPENGYDIAHAIAVDRSGNVVVTGESVSSRGDSVVYYTAKYAAAAGAQVWEKRYDGNGITGNAPGYAQAVAVDASGNVVVTGYSDGSAYNHDYYTAKYAAADGALLWQKRYNGPANYNDLANAVAVDGSGNVVVTGYSFNGTNYDYYTAKHAAADGALLWEQRYNGPANGYDEATAVAVDGSGNVVVTGYSVNGTNASSYTVKYAAADGALLWEKLRPGGGIRVTMDSSGNVVMTGNSWNGTSFDYSTAKYAAADGTLLWEKYYNGPADGDDGATAVAVDGSGNVVVTGLSAAIVSDMSGSIFDYYTAKYAAADGALLWETGYNGPANGDDFAAAMAVDGSGNVVVTGESWNGRNNDYYTVKYAAADGALLWEQRYNSPPDGYDFAAAVAVDDSGNVVVTGTSHGGRESGDYYTAKYAATDGELLWEKSYNGPANGDDQVGRRHCLALGPNGMIVVTGSSVGPDTAYYATVVYRETLPPVSIALVPGGIRLRFTGTPGQSYNIERAPAVAGPWNTINTQAAPASGLLEYHDALPEPGSGFYRTVQP
jgi:uncharacterized delta-60 repeat protein